MRCDVSWLSGARTGQLEVRKGNAGTCGVRHQGTNHVFRPLSPIGSLLRSDSPFPVKVSIANIAMSYITVIHNLLRGVVYSCPFRACRSLSVPRLLLGVPLWEARITGTQPAFLVHSISLLPIGL